MPKRYFTEGSDVYEQKFIDEAQVFAQCHSEGDAVRVADTLNHWKEKAVRSWQFGAETVAKSFFRRGDQMIYVSTIKPYLCCIEDDYAPPPETCAWLLDENDCRGEMIFGPERHYGDDLTALHAESVQAISAGYAVLDDFRRQEQETPHD